MVKAIIGRKVGMTQIFTEKGKMIPVTVIEAGPCTVLQKKTDEKEGYESIQLGFGDVKEARLSKPEMGHIKKAGASAKKFLKEFKLDDMSAYNVGDEIKVDIFTEGERVDITGTSKGKGYSGTVKRWNFGMQASSHGVGPVHRSVGSTGANSSPSKVAKGHKMPGQLGVEQVTILNLDVVKVDAEKNLIAVKGAVPGPKKGIVYLRNSVINV